MNEQLRKFLSNIDLFDILLLIAIVILSLNDAYGSGWLMLLLFIRNIKFV